MKRHKPIYLKMIGVILILLIPAILLYTYFSRASIQVINTQMTDYNDSQLMFLKNQIEANIERLSLSSSVLVQDSSILNLQLSILTKDYYRMLDFQTHVKEKLNLQSLSSNWSNHLSVYLPTIQTRVSTDLSESYDQKILDEASNGKWRFHPGDSRSTAYYQLFLWDPFLSKFDSQSINAIFEIRFGLDNIRKMLQHYKMESPGFCFLLTADGRAFSNTDSNDEEHERFGADLLNQGLSGSGHKNVQFNGQKIFLSYAYLPELDAFLIDYVPTHMFHEPIIKSRNLFYYSMGLLILLGFAASYVLYLNVQKPVAMIMKGLKHFEMGNYSFRIDQRFNNEFDYMMQRFNDMGTRIQHLIQNVYEEQNRSRLATLKQLQSQINPHFLYNCLFFIAGCAKVGLTETIKDMAYHLGGYYRYITRVENQMPLLKEEVELVTHYLKIYSYRLERLEYQINIPQEMLNEPVMRLVVQPVVENAIVHGIEPKTGHGTVLITGYREVGWNILLIEDSGEGMTKQEIQESTLRLDQPMNNKTGCGLWNVHQRLMHRYGQDAGIIMKSSERLSGLCVMLRWKREQDSEGGNV
ncbi:two-component system, sensor histidine kinase YesM [Paenibacillus sp. cl141a]|uniref:sensor histidine kinase n=1 Tax=Paenibacillus sp. cl141a TaxID=1761877 RepID=UPI0008D19F91|nr:histidine kinase [Paenibacillus sp. cl141a]SEL94555.1 two-component system, sensor histidine kinase YesM [Paenibacillus sp. cl141a]